MITYRPCVQTTLPFFWHLGLIKYYNTPVSLCGFSCVSLRYISLWPFYYRKMTVLLTRTKLFKDFLRKKFQLKAHLIFCPFRPLAWELRLGLDHRWLESVASRRRGCPTLALPVQGSSKPLSPLTRFLLSRSQIASKFSPEILPGFSSGPLADVSTHLLGCAVTLLITAVAARGAVSTETEPVKDLPSISCLTTGLLQVALITVLKEHWFIPYLFPSFSPKSIRHKKIWPQFFLPGCWKTFRMKLDHKTSVQTSLFSMFFWQRNQR